MPVFEEPPEREQVPQRLHIRHCQVETACDWLIVSDSWGAALACLAHPKVVIRIKNEFFVG